MYYVTISEGKKNLLLIFKMLPDEKDLKLEPILHNHGHHSLRLTMKYILSP